MKSTLFLLAPLVLAVSMALSPEAHTVAKTRTASSLATPRYAFAPTAPLPGGGDSRLFFRDGNDGYTVPPPTPAEIAATRVTPTPSLPAQIDLPRHTTIRSPNAVQAAALVDTAELTVGRTAMIAALVFLSVELATGQSIPEQIAAFCSHPML